MAGPEPVGGIALVTCADDDLSRLSSPAPTRSPMLTHTGLVRELVMSFESTLAQAAGAMTS